MQLRGLLFLGLFLGAEASRIVARQNTDSAAADPTTAAADPTTEAEVVTTSAADDTPTTVDEPTDSPTDDGTSEDTPTTTDAGDVTVTRTRTVTDNNVATVSRSTTVMRTITSTVLVTSTAFKTTTVTSSDADTATKTVYVTSTKWANEKRALDLAPRTIGGPEELVAVAAAPTVTSIPEDFVPKDVDGEHYGLRAFRRGILHKRATVTEFVTITEGEDSGTTVFNTISRTVISTVSSQTKITKTITETEQADAKTTVTVTSTLEVTSTRVTTGVVRTETVAPSGEYGPSGTGGADSDSGSDSSNDDKGLSTGAKAGIGAGAGVAGLVVIAGLIWFCLKKRRSNKHKAEYDDVFGASEVPVGGPVNNNNPTTPNMSQVSPVTASSTLAPSRNPTKGSTPEGYRGTALGDGRAGFAKPLPYGRAYMPTSPETQAVSPETQYSRTAVGTDHGSPNHATAKMYSPTNTAELASDSAAAKWHQNDAAEIDGNQVSSARGTAPPDNVYEMPAQPYR
ncbi:hypothetical protein FALBO_1840 [Fusarium albosuccineum]|uniref:Mid2 domain-containing protein n=1 Tax=Fusarium albosuccineum TaxID=1237068 RepID=A0A8H4PD70_9HYPO|nr:hypothetical protein FALBO_1840 [Fusarium albosuccineum]